MRFWVTALKHSELYIVLKIGQKANLGHGLMNQAVTNQKIAKSHFPFCLCNLLIIKAVTQNKNAHFPIWVTVLKINELRAAKNQMKILCLKC